MPERINQLYYTALGDSIAFGIGAANNYGYVQYFKDFLSTLYNKVMLINHAVPGFSSSNLLNQLKEDAVIREDVKNANIITISNGGVNLLGCLVNGTDINDACAAKGVLTFINDWPKIMDEIRSSICSKAQILVMTLYNPFKGSDPNYNKAENYIQQINYLINHMGYRFMYDYKVSDVHTDFQGLFPDGNWKACTLTHFCEPVPDPHPTDSGHIEIARQHEAIYCKNIHQ